MILRCIQKNHLKITKNIQNFALFSEQIAPPAKKFGRSRQLSNLTLSPLSYNFFFQLLSQFSIQSEMSIVAYHSYIYYYIPSIGGNHNTCQIIRDIFWNVLLIMKSIGASASPVVSTGTSHNVNHTLQISKFKCFNPLTWRKSQSRFALNLHLKYLKHYICPILKPDSLISPIRYGL